MGNYISTISHTSQPSPPPTINMSSESSWVSVDRQSEMIVSEPPSDIIKPDDPPQLTLVPVRNIYAIQNIDVCATKLSMSRSKFVKWLNDHLEDDDEFKNFIKGRQMSGGVIAAIYNGSVDDRQQLELILNTYINREVLHKKTKNDRDQIASAVHKSSHEDDENKLTLVKLKANSYSVLNLDKYATEQNLTIPDMVGKINAKLKLNGYSRRLYFSPGGEKIIFDMAKNADVNNINKDMVDNLELLLKFL